MPAYVTTELPKRYHQALVDWQRKHFKDYDFFIDNWHRYYRQAPFRLLSKVGEATEVIEHGRLRGRPKFTRAHDMKGNMFYQAAAIIKAQASTEFGSIQQHRETLDQALDDETRFDVLRIMAEELRHGYQMCWVFAHDDWTTGGSDLAREAIEELLAMETGSHVLDSFNIPFERFLDNIIYASLIDRVGKFQLTMQKIFAYRPMAQSMPPMLQEESFHMACGVNPLRKIATQAADEKGGYSIQDVQRHINKWYPRGLEMFGTETGGTTNVDYGFKDLKNSDAVDAYIQEVQDLVIDPANLEILKVRKSGQVDKALAKEIAARILALREGVPGVKADEVLHLPDRRWLRRRGVHAWSLVTPRGEPVKDLDEYRRVCEQSLPDSYLRTHDFKDYWEGLEKHVRGESETEAGAGFRVS